jgi:hypothetical protein
MTAPHRMLDQDASPMERQLLESAEQDTPPRDGPRSLIRSLGAGTILASVDAVGSPDSQGAARSKVHLVMGAKWLGAGLVAGAITAGALRWASPPQAPRVSETRTGTAAVSAQSEEKASQPVSQAATGVAQEAKKANEPLSVPASPPIRSGGEETRTGNPAPAAKARRTTTVRRRVVSPPNSSRRPTQPARLEPASPHAQPAAATLRPSTSTASSVAAFPDR